MKKALFLDRDGVINIDHGYVYQIENFDFMPGILSLCKRFYDQGFQLVVVTNQSGIGRKYYTEEDFEVLTQWLRKEFENNGSPLSSVYHCPHHPEQDCTCRKPLPGMFLKAKEDLGLNMEQSVMIGDKTSDMQAAHASGVGRRILLTTKSVSESELGFTVEQVRNLVQIQTSVSE